VQGYGCGVRVDLRQFNIGECGADHRHKDVMRCPVGGLADDVGCAGHQDKRTGALGQGPPAGHLVDQRGTGPPSGIACGCLPVQHRGDEGKHFLGASAHDGRHCRGAV
jgi:hypothetical protein